MKRWIRMTIICIAALLALTVPVCAYDEMLDPETGAPIGPGTDSSLYDMPDGSRFDRESGYYTYPVGKASFTATVPNGAVLPYGETVSLWPDATGNVSVHRDGVLLTDQDLTKIRQPGSYVVTVPTPNGLGELNFRFTIVGDLTNALTDLTLPQGWLLDYVLLDTVPQDLPYGDHFQAASDGTYEIRYSCLAIDRHYILKFTLDATPPELVLPGVVDGKIQGAVTVTVPQEVDHVDIISGDQTTTLRGGYKELRQPGQYRIDVYDAAGNLTSYPLTIEFYLDISASVAIGLVAAALTAVVVYCIIVRKKARVG